MNRILVLDAGGVIVDDLSTQFWDILVSKSTNTALTRAQIYTHYKQEISERLWSDQIDEHGFIQFLNNYNINISLEQLDEIVAQCLVPLPAFDMIAAWSKKIDVYIMSNHRTSWLLPALAAIQPYIKQIYVSDVARIKKPSLDWFNLISHQHPHTQIVFVDNTMHNIEAARQTGWQTIFADQSHQWIEEVNELIRGLA